MTRVSKNERVRRDMLKGRGLTKGRYGKLLDEPKEKLVGIAAPGLGREGKTPLMLALERIFSLDIDLLLVIRDSEREVADVLGIDETTVSKWRLRRGLRTTRPLSDDETNDHQKVGI